MKGSLGGRTLLVGLGDIGMGYDLISESAPTGTSRTSVRTHASAIAACTATELVCGVDPSPDRRRRFQAAFNASARASVEGLSGIQVDMAVVAVPTASHVDVAITVMNTCAPRLLLCEKPVGMSASEARAILAEAQQRGITVAVNYFRHYLPSLREVRNRVESGYFGELLGGNVLYSHGLQRNGSHFVALLLWLFGDAVVNRGPARNDSVSDPGFALTLGKASVDFSSLGNGRVRAAEICLGFSQGMLRITNGGREISWSPLEDEAESMSAVYTRREWELCDDMSACQLPIYEWLTSPSVSQSEIDENVSIAIRTQEVIDMVMADAGGEVNHAEGR